MSNSTLLSLQQQYGYETGRYIYKHRDEHTDICDTLTDLSIQSYRTPLDTTENISLLIKRKKKIIKQLHIAKEEYETYSGPCDHMRARIVVWETLLLDVEYAILKLDNERNSNSCKRKQNSNEIQSKRPRNDLCASTAEPRSSEDTVPTSRSSSCSDSSDDEDGLRLTPSYIIKDNYSKLDGNFKMMLCVNTSLQMSKGKIAAQCGHATLGAYRLAARYAKSAVRWWYKLGQAKIAVKVPNDKALHELERKVSWKALLNIFNKRTNIFSVGNGCWNSGVYGTRCRSYTSSPRFIYSSRNRTCPFPSHG